MKITFTKHTVGKEGKQFTFYDTKVFGSSVRASKTLLDELAKLKPDGINGTSAEYNLSDEVTKRLIITATGKNGFTNLYLTLKKPEKFEEVKTEDDLPF